MMQESIDLLSETLLKNHKRKYNFLHLGSIQVAIKPLYRLGLDTPICVCLRDTQPYRFEDQILSIIETNLHDGPKYFNNFPIYTIALDSLGNNKHNIKLDIKILDKTWNPKSYPFVIIYRMYYKAMRSKYHT